MSWLGLFMQTSSTPPPPSTLRNLLNTHFGSQFQKLLSSIFDNNNLNKKNTTQNSPSFLSENAQLTEDIRFIQITLNECLTQIVIHFGLLTIQFNVGENFRQTL